MVEERYGDRAIWILCEGIVLIDTSTTMTCHPAEYVSIPAPHMPDSDLLELGITVLGSSTPTICCPASVDGLLLRVLRARAP
jgi:hypothetical protein